MEHRKDIDEITFGAIYFESGGESLSYKIQERRTDFALTLCGALRFARESIFTFVGVFTTGTG